MQISIRLVRPEEAATLSAFAARLFLSTYGPVCREEDVLSYVAEHFTTERQEAELRAPGSWTLVVEEDGRWIGYAQLRMHAPPTGEAGAAPAEIARFYVEPAWHGLGVAPRLMQACLQGIREAGGDAAWLSVWQENGRAVRFYEKEGWRRIGTQSFRMGDDVQRDHLMTLPLSPSAPDGPAFRSARPADAVTSNPAPGEPYVPIDCSIHDRLEALATLRRRSVIAHRTRDGGIARVEARIVDVYTRDGAEWIALEGGEVLRLDTLVEVDGEAVRPAC